MFLFVRFVSFVLFLLLLFFFLVLGANRGYHNFENCFRILEFALLGQGNILFYLLCLFLLAIDCFMKTSFLMGLQQKIVPH